MTDYSVEDIKREVKPLSKNAFLRPFQQIYRWWLLRWYSFADKHPKSSKLIYVIAFFCIFSMSTAILQFILMTFLPYAFENLNEGPWGIPYVPLKVAGDQPYIVLGDVQGLGYFIAFELATFTAQCINFPLQRNITYHSHGNVWFQAMWYFIGWVLVSLFTSALWGVFNCFLLYWNCSDVLIGLIKTIVTSGICLVVFFFIFLIIFPDNEKVAKNKRKHYEKLVKTGAYETKIAIAKEKMEKAEQRAEVSNAENFLRQAKIKASSSAMLYFALLDNLDETEDKKVLLKERYKNVNIAIEEKYNAQQRFDRLLMSKDNS